MDESFYNLEPEEYMKLDLKKMSAQDLKELDYFLWCCHSDDEAIMKWHKEILSPLVSQLSPPLDFQEEYE